MFGAKLEKIIRWDKWLTHSKYFEYQLAIKFRMVEIPTIETALIEPLTSFYGDIASG